MGTFKINNPTDQQASFGVQGASDRGFVKWCKTPEMWGNARVWVTKAGSDEKLTDSVGQSEIRTIKWKSQAWFVFDHLEAGEYELHVDGYTISNLKEEEKGETPFGVQSFGKLQSLSIESI